MPNILCRIAYDGITVTACVTCITVAYNIALQAVSYRCVSSVSSIRGAECRSLDGGTDRSWGDAIERLLDGADSS